MGIARYSARACGYGRSSSRRTRAYSGRVRAVRRTAPKFGHSSFLDNVRNATAYSLYSHCRPRVGLRMLRRHFNRKQHSHIPEKHCYFGLLCMVASAQQSLPRSLPPLHPMACGDIDRALRTNPVGCRIQRAARSGFPSLPARHIHVPCRNK